MTREEAIKQVREWPFLNNDDKEVFALLIPELHESEDEKIRKDLIGGLMWQRDNICRLGPHDDNLILPGFCENVGKHLSYLKKQKEPKPALRLVGDGLYSDTNAHFELESEQKPAEKQDYSGLTDLERAIHRGFLSAGVENVPVTIIKETAQECLAHIDKPAEGTEEDRRLSNLIAKCIALGVKQGLVSDNDNIACLDLLRRKDTSWSEGDEAMLNLVIAELKLVGKHADAPRLFETGIAWLKSLRPQPKREWSEEDNVMILRIEIYLAGYARNYPRHRDNVVRCIEWLDATLRSRPIKADNWKPTEEQMRAIAAISVHPVCSKEDLAAINSLYEDLLKLM